jgi:hypothetical protein
MGLSLLSFLSVDELLRRTLDRAQYRTGKVEEIGCADGLTRQASARLSHTRDAASRRLYASEPKAEEESPAVTGFPREMRRFDATASEKLLEARAVDVIRDEGLIINEHCIPRHARIGGSRKQWSTGGEGGRCDHRGSHLQETTPCQSKVVAHGSSRSSSGTPCSPRCICGSWRSLQSSQISRPATPDSRPQKRQKALAQSSSRGMK